MATPRKIDGYEWRYQIARGKSALKKSRQALQRIVDGRRIEQSVWVDVAEAALGLQEATEALEELAEISRR